jgi:hypothetical protein
MLIPLPGPPVLINEPALIILCPYRRRSAFSFALRFPSLGRIAGIMDRLTGFYLRRFIAENCNHAANPKSPRYQVGLVKDLIATFNVKEASIAICDDTNDQSAFDELRAMGEVTFCEASSVPRATLESSQSVILVYQDALGLGWSRQEARVRKVTQADPIFVNGRRRMMVLNSRSVWRLKWRRVLARTRGAELLFAIILVPVSFVWAAADGLKGKS